MSCPKDFPYCRDGFFRSACNLIEKNIDLMLIFTKIYKFFKEFETIEIVTSKIWTPVQMFN